VANILRCRFDYAGEGPPRAFELTSVRGQVAAWQPSDVVAMLDEAEVAVRKGWYAAGFVAYEAAPAFDDSLAVRSDPCRPGVPLAWFGFFAESRPVAALPRLDAPAPGGHEEAAWKAEIGPTEHAAAVEHIRAAIAAGETYLVNYTTRFRRPWASTDDPFALYRRLAAGHAGGYHAYLETADWVVACGAPELFFEWSGDRLTTRPMKGTAPRGRWPEEDLLRAEELGSSPKERAENVMVVDLLRNDVGRVAVPGTVAVPELWQTERHPSLWQLTSTVTATTRPGIRLAEVFGAMFPCGSVTGAPKTSAMAAIAHLEASSRGVYCGAVGLLRPGSTSDPASTSPTANFAVAIRTAVVDKAGARVEYGSGGGITWDSSPASEWEETLVKTRTLKRPVVLLGDGGGLIETMRFDPDHAGDGEWGVRNLQGHLARLAASAAYLGAGLPADVENTVVDAVSALSTPARVRLVLHLNGVMETQISPLPGDGPVRTQCLCVDLEPVTSTDVTLFHKTTDRTRYDERARRHLTADDVVLVNERGEVTETTRANLAVRIDDRWWTPSLDCGLLPGIERARLLRTGHLTERVVTVEQLRHAASVATLSSLRGWRPAQVRFGCIC
jgi:para-aminobenzoate synthetase / 4-amino-4-deoxychorismate lyase